MNPAIELITKRQSLRAFSSRAVDEATLQTLKSATLRAPTAGNQMFYSIVEVTSPEKKKELARLCDNQIMIANAPLVWVFLADCLKWENFYKEAGSVAKGLEQGIQPRKLGLGDMHLAMQDAIIAAQNCVVAAESLGLGSCYIGDVLENHEEMKTLLNLKPNVMVACMLIIGYPKNENRATSNLTPRCPADAIFMENEYIEPHLEQLEKAYKAHEEGFRATHQLPFNNTGSIADRYYFKKHMSAFMAEMNRSAELMIEEWKEN